MVICGRREDVKRQREQREKGSRGKEWEGVGRREGGE
jgi:hypothetical protein